LKMSSKKFYVYMKKIDLDATRHLYFIPLNGIKKIYRFENIDFTQVHIIKNFKN